MGCQLAMGRWTGEILTVPLISGCYKKDTAHAAGVNGKYIKLLPYMWKGGGNPHHWEAEDNQLKRPEYDENNLASIKHSICSWTPYSWKKTSERVGKMKRRMSVGKRYPLTNNAYSTEHTQDCADSIPSIAAVDANTDVKPTLWGRRS